MRTRAAALAAVAAFAVAVTGVAVVAARSGEDSGLELLPFTDAGAERADAAMSLAAPGGGGFDYVVQGTLPDLPRTAPGYRLGDEGGSGGAERVAGALGVESDKVTVESVPGLPWYLASDTPDRAVAACRGYATPLGRSGPGAPDTAEMGSCEAGSPIPAPPVVDLPSKAEAERIAREVFGKLGLVSDDLQTFGGEFSWQVSVAPKVGGFPTIGFEHGLSVGSKGEIADAHGYLAEPKRIGDYPLVDLQAGLDRLRNDVGAGGRPRTLAARDIGMGEPGNTYVISITGAHLALLHVADVLVPVYVFEAADGATFPVPAVTDRWLEQQAQDRPQPVPVPDTVHQAGAARSRGTCSASASGVGVDPDMGRAEGANQPLTVQVCVEPSRAKVGQEVRFEVTATDPDAEIYTGICEAPVTAFGDEEFLASTDCAIACKSSGEPGVPGKLSRTYQHTYAKAGTYTARFPFRSGPCTKGASQGEGTIEVVVVG